MTSKFKGILSEEDVKNFTELIQSLENSPFDYFKIENENVQIAIGKEGMDVINPLSTKSTATSQIVEIPPKPAAEVEKGGQEFAASTQEITVEKPSTEKVSEADGVVQVKALTAGIFYAQSEPGAPPYVKIGDRVEEDTTVGLIEIMKVYSGIVAGVKGEIVGIHVEDGDLIEEGQVIFSVKTN